MKPTQRTAMMLRLIFGLLLFAAPSFAATLTVPGSVNVVPLDISTVTTGGTAVIAINPGNRSAGGFLQNPKGASADLCINELGTATGTVSAGNTTCIAAGLSYNVAPGIGSVSVISSDSSHAFSGYGLKQ